MPLFRPTLLINDGYGSAGDITWYHSEGKCYTRKRTRPQYAATSGQLEHLDVHRRALAAWRAVPHSIQLVWNHLAEGVEPHKPPFDHSSSISGQNLFVSAYHGFATLGNEHVPEPMDFESFPPFAVQLGDASVESGSLVIPVTVSLGVEKAPERYRLLAKLQFTEPGKGCHPGYLRNYLADANCDSDNIHIRVPLSSALGGNNPGQCQVHGRFILMDNINGYRSQYHKQSFLIHTS